MLRILPPTKHAKTTAPDQLLTQPVQTHRCNDGGRDMVGREVVCAAALPAHCDLNDMNGTSSHNLGSATELAYVGMMVVLVMMVMMVMMVMIVMCV